MLDFDISSYLFLGSVPLVIALVQVVKLWTKDTRLYPVAAIVLALVVNVGIGLALYVPLVHSVVMGIVAGVMAAGVYSTATSGRAS